MRTEKKAHIFSNELTSEQRAKLKGRAHHLKPIVQIGGQGFSEAVIQEVISALTKHELIKIKLPGNSDADSKQQEQQELNDKLPTHSHIVGRIGRTIILYLEKEPKEAKIILKNL
ncbi:YhbY family RNA-binding protein [Spirobacillus cienkowskii]|uniref:Ribosome assembly RNA-binding protein YhbY n=1 Tax=Spirobacillus cienkowskii TaxID=495820 RepID=A0A369KQF4_9BACT|nr:MAG: ribosome assembly RNA-binding protein YhbY [Spirobacillus cienkowskii]